MGPAHISAGTLNGNERSAQYSGVLMPCQTVKHHTIYHSGTTSKPKQYLNPGPFEPPIRQAARTPPRCRFAQSASSEPHEQAEREREEGHLPATTAEKSLSQSGEGW